jgi:hypothetical protein
LTEAERYENWATRITTREASLKTKISRWDKYLRFYRHDLTEEEAPDKDSVWINYMFAFSRIILPAIYYRNPDVLAKPRGATPLPYATLCEMLLNYHLSEINYESEARKSVTDALFCGIGVQKVGVPSYQEVPETEADDLAALLMESAFESEVKARSRNVDQRIHPHLPFAIRVSPRFFLADPLATCLEDARWVCHRILRPVAEVKSSKLYPRSLTSGIESTHSIKDTGALNEVPEVTSSTDRKNAPGDDELVMLYEIWDMESGKIIVLDSHNMSFGKKVFLREDPIPYNMDGYPFELLIFNPDPESLYGISDSMTWYNPTNALNLLNSMHYNHVKRFNRKYGARKGALEPDEMAKFQSPVDGTVVEVNGVQQDLWAIQDGPISPDLYNLRAVIRDELTFITGVTEQRRGGSDRTKTATEASLIEQQARIRDSDRLYCVSMFVEKVVKKLHQLNRQFLDPSYVQFVTGSEAAAFWTKVGADVLKADVDVKIRIGSSSFVSREIRAKQLLDFLNLTANLMDPLTGIPVVNVRELISRVAEALEIDDYQSLIFPAMPTMLPGPQGQMAGGPQPPGQGPVQASPLRTGNPNLGNMLSNVQNLGVRRSGRINPVAEVNA